MADKPKRDEFEIFRELEPKIREIWSRCPPMTEDQALAEVMRLVSNTERRKREVLRKQELEEKINLAMADLIPRAPRWKEKKLVAEFVKLRPLRLYHRIDFTSPPDPRWSLPPPQTGRRRRPPMAKEERAVLSVMPDAERAFVEIEWFLTKCYPDQIKKAIRDRAYEFAAAQFGIRDAETLRKYCKRSAGERQRLWPRPKITFP
jgi:hypothetical protein